MAVNYRGSSTLHGEGTIFQRLGCVSNASWDKAREHFLMRVQYKPVRQVFEDMRLPSGIKDSLPLIQDGSKLLSVLEQYVRSYLDIFYNSDEAVTGDQELAQYWSDVNTPLTGRASLGLPSLTKEALIDQIVHCIWSVTALHEISGSIGELVMLPDGMSTRIYSSQQTRPNVLSLFQGAALLCLTSLRMPMRMGSDWMHFYLMEHKTKVLGIREVFMNNLNDLANDIEMQNKSRPKPFHSCNPAYLEVSASL